MRLTFHTDYGLRLLMLLALEPGGLHTIEEAATRYGVSRNHLMKVAVTLARAGFIEGVRGRKGGLRLTQPVSAITVGAVVRATEDSLALVECFDRPGNTCVIAPACRLKGVLHEAVAAFLATLDRYTLAQLVASPDRVGHLRRLLPYIPIAAATSARAPVIHKPRRPARKRAT